MKELKFSVCIYIISKNILTSIKVVPEGFQEFFARLSFVSEVSTFDFFVEIAPVASGPRGGWIRLTFALPRLTSNAAVDLSFAYAWCIRIPNLIYFFSAFALFSRFTRFSRRAASKPRISLSPRGLINRAAASCSRRLRHRR